MTYNEIQVTCSRKLKKSKNNDEIKITKLIVCDGSSGIIHQHKVLYMYKNRYYFVRM